MGADHSFDLWGQIVFKGLIHGLRLEQRRTGHFYGHVRDSRQGPGDRIMLVAGHQHRISRLDQGMDSQIEGVGGVEGKDDLLRGGHVEQPRRRLPAGECDCRGLHSRIAFPFHGERFC